MNERRDAAAGRSRFGIRATVVVPGARTSDDAVGAPVAFLAAAREYFSGRRLASG